MNLERLLCFAKVQQEEVTLVPVSFGGHDFDVLIKNRPTVADLEYIYSTRGEEDSVQARRIHRFVMLEDGERIPYEEAKLLRPEFVALLTEKIGMAHKGETEKKS